jgi:N-methylhydantoinase A
VLSALGGLIADIRNDFLETVYADLDVPSLPRIQAAFARLGTEAKRWIRHEQNFTGPIVLQPSAEMRYRGQSFEITVPLRQDWIERADLTAIADAFHAAHERMYGHADPAAPIQAIALSMTVSGAVAPPRLPEQERTSRPPAALREVPIFVDGAQRKAPLFARGSLRHGHALAGPAIVLAEDSTTCIPPGMQAEVDRFGNLILTLG